MARLDSTPMSLPKSSFLLPVGIAAAALALFLWPVPEPPPLPAVEMSAAPKLHFAAHDEVAASPRDAYAPIPMLRARPDRAIGAVRDLGGPVKAEAVAQTLSDVERKQIEGECQRLVDQFKELETVAATVTYDGDFGTGHLRFVRMNEPSPQHLSALYDAGTATVSKFSEGTPAYETMRQRVAELVADFSETRLLSLETKADTPWRFSITTGNPKTTGVPDQEGGIHFEGPAKTKLLTGTGDMTTDPATERYWHLFKR